MKALQPLLHCRLGTLSHLSRPGFHASQRILSILFANHRNWKSSDHNNSGTSDNILRNPWSRIYAHGKREYSSGRRRRTQDSTPYKPWIGDVDTLIADFTAATNSSDTTQGDVRNHLKGLQPWLASLPADSRAGTVAEHKIGRRALAWIWANGLEKTQAFHKDHELAGLLTLFLVAEKQDKYIEQWICTKVPASAESALGASAWTWRSTLWRAIVRAEFVLMDKATASADAAIKRFFEIRQLREDNVDKSMGMSAWPALICLAEIIARWHLPNTSPEQFNRVLGFLQRFEGKTSSPRMYGAMMMRHPTRPNGVHYLNYGKQLHGHHDSVLADFRIDSTKRLSGNIADLERLLKLLHDAGDEENEKWVRDLLQNMTMEGARLWNDSPWKIDRPGPTPHAFRE